MSGKFPWFQVTVMTAGLFGVGYALMKATVPTPEQTYAAMSPDLRRKVDANRAARLAREEATKRQLDAQSDDADKPVWADPPTRK
ncbi:hypothetical protein GLOTRDRAFT_110195 [Gloeophyllum trabeum ATCC 11539]|uniref:Uncharacterized protein n=1 Tax=Gloeophyllum trabeum (strain ATCC 11539 / FP-39264 / Madison 617) TaxID=670483 RepID=S7QGS3_GLOTA|nr:uncharacterized protein GLOTRDRAFT_110195 [Gloeophyllum trabeum ATCC 11539]EPQ58423.1 hypothetical protein GLOTRDRAFT_110195 [Gloeophyllum trabeum ATCC 11539]